MRKILFILTLLIGLNARSQQFFMMLKENTATPKTIQVNLYANSDPSGLSGWNDWAFISSPTSSSFNYTDATSSGITATCDATDYVQNAGGYTSSPMCPDLVGKYGAKPPFGSNVNITLNNLNNSKTYDIEIYGTFNSGFAVNTTFGITGGSSTVINTNNNSTSAAVFTGLTPSSGHITFYANRSDWFGYINGFKITEH